MSLRLEQNVQDGGTLQMMQNRVDNVDKKSQSKKSGSFNKIGFGWAVLQIDILRECIVISEAIQGTFLLYKERRIEFNSILIRSCFHVVLYHCSLKKSLSVHFQRRANQIGLFYPTYCQHQ
jgi:hypothetical protein